MKKHEILLSGLVALALGAALASDVRAAGSASLGQMVQAVQPRIAKVYGAGGFRGLESFQSGIVISDRGHVLTVWSYVLDTDDIRVTLDDGRRFDAELLGADPQLEIAVLKIDAQDLPYFELEAFVSASSGTRILAFSNLFGVATGNEPASVQHGVVAVRTRLEARRGVFETPYRGDVYILDAITNNPGAAGGALTNQRGQLVGLLGKELRNRLSDTWLNYAVPIEQLIDTVDEIMAGNYSSRRLDQPAIKPEQTLSLGRLGVVLVPDVLERTPPYIEFVQEDTPAAQAGIRPDDLVLFVNDHLVQSCKELFAELEYIDVADAVKLTLIRDQQLIDVVLSERRADAAGEEDF